MDYQKIYNLIIERCKNRIIEGYSKRHHIIPKSLGGTNDSFNLVRLTAREHFICHLLLAKIYAGGMIYAAWKIAKCKGIKINSKVYEWLRAEHSKRVSERLKGSKQTKERIRNRVIKNTGQKRTEEQKANISAGTIGKKHIFIKENGGFKKGHIPYNKGKRYTKEEKEFIYGDRKPPNLKGHKFSREVILKRIKTRKKNREEKERNDEGNNKDS